MTHPAHIATSGGGTLFEYKVAILLTSDMIRARLTEHEGVVVSLGMQTGPPVFDDLQITLELLDRSHRTVHAQCRHRQLFTASDAKFATLLAEAQSTVTNDEASFAAGERRLAIVVDQGSPGHASMTALCELARKFEDLTRFVGSVEAHGGTVASRWTQCLQASSTEPAATHRVLAAMEVRALEVRTATSKDSLELINRLAEAWSPPNAQNAVDLANALFKHLTETGPVAGVIDMRSLQTHLGRYLPATIGATTRRAQLSRMRDACHERVAMTLRAVGLDDDDAIALATRALVAPPSVSPPMGFTVVTGPMGVGKTTELERLHRQALDRALEDPNAPVPLIFHAREIGNTALQAIAADRAAGLGDASRNGAHLVVDGLDEVDMQIADIAAQVATLLAAWPGSTVIVASRPEPTPPKLHTEVLQPLSRQGAAELMGAIDPDAHHWLPSRTELDEVLRRPLFAIRYAMDRRSGNPAGIREAQIIDSVGRHAIAELGYRGDEIYDLLVRLACRIVDSGGRPIDPNSLEATPARVQQVVRSRIIHTIDGSASFQLAALTEWFAANALLRDDAMLQHAVSTPSSAHRWRYALVQALLQGSANDVDKIMSTLLSQRPATGAGLPQRQDTLNSRTRGTARHSSWASGLPLVRRTHRPSSHQAPGASDRGTGLQVAEQVKAGNGTDWLEIPAQGGY